MCCCICTARTGVERHSHVETDGLPLCLSNHLPMATTPTPSMFPSTPPTKTTPNTRRTTHHVATGSGQSHARLNGCRRDSSAAAATHHETGRHWVFGHAKFRGRANQENERRSHGMSPLSKRDTGCSFEGCCCSFDAPSCVTRKETF